MDETIDGDCANVCVDRTMRTLQGFVNDLLDGRAGKKPARQIMRLC
jgi:hypothetical protein